MDIAPLGCSETPHFKQCMHYSHVLGPFCMSLYLISTVLLLQAIKDWHLFLGTTLITSIIIVVILISFVVPTLRPLPIPADDVERPQGYTVSTTICMTVCMHDVHVYVCTCVACIACTYVCMHVAYMCIHMWQSQV